MPENLSKNMKKIIQKYSVGSLAGQITLVSTGIVAGASATGFLLNPIGLRALGVVLAGIAGLGLGAVLFSVFSRILFSNALGRWNEDRVDQLFNEVIETSRKPDLIHAFMINNRENIKEITQVGFKYLIATRSLAYVGMALGAIVSVATLISAYVQMETLEEQNRLIVVQNSLTEASRRSSLNFELSNVLNLLASDKANPLLYARTAAVSRSFRPYRYLRDDGFLSDPLSPERAQLLVSLLAVDMDLKAVADNGATFAFADLSGANLANANLLGVDLSHSDMTGADVGGVTFSYADLSHASLPPVPSNPIRIANANLEGATTSDPDWLVKVLSAASKSSNLVTRQIPPRFEGEIQFVLLHTDDRSGNMEYATRYNIGNSELQQYSGWFVDNGVIIKRPAVFEFSNWEKQLEIEIRSELSMGADEIFANRRRELYRMISDWKPHQISKNVELIGSADLNDIFEFLSDQGEFLENLNFRGVSPGSRDNVVVVSSPSGSPSNFPSLTSADFSFADLRYVDFGKSNLSGANFSNSILPSFERIEETKLDGALFDDAIVDASWPSNFIAKLGYDIKEDCDILYDRDTGLRFEGNCTYTLVGNTN